MAWQRSGPLRAFRIADARHPIFDGTGAFLHGGRWNSPGRRLVYAAETFSGALLEMLVHTNIGRTPRTQAYVEILVPETVAMEGVGSEDLPGWDARGFVASRAYGNRWYDQRRSAVLVVPSIVARAEHNVLIHQEHPDSSLIRASDPRPVVWDERLFR